MRRTADWLRQAEADFRAANNLTRSEDYAFACFAAQQAAEKALKAVLEERVVPAFGHDLFELVGAVQDTGLTVPGDVVEACARLNRMYIPTRYPDAFAAGAPADRFTRQDAEGAVADAERIIGFARGAVRPTAH